MSTNKRLPKGLSVIEHNGQLLAKLYNTIIVIFETKPQYNTHVLKLDNGGWRTMHTKKCINLVLSQYGIRVVQKKGQWYVYHNETMIGLWQRDTPSLRLWVKSATAA